MRLSTVVAVAVVAIGVCTSAPALAGAVTVLPAGSQVAGRSVGDYTADWWQWALGFTAPDDPFSDADGAKANLNQSGPVFFLAGNAGGSSTRSFTVPAGKHLLVPLLVAELSQLEVGFGKTPAEVRQASKDQTDSIDSLKAVINGQTVPDLFGHREVSPDFSFTAAQGNPIGVPAGASGVAVADGFWLMLAPPPPGETFTRSEERRVGKECRSRWSPYH